MKNIFFTLFFAIFFKCSFAQIGIIAPALTINPAGCTFPSSYNNLGNMTITESATNDIRIAAAATNYTITLSISSNFEFNPGVGTISPNGGGDITSLTLTVNATNFVITYRSSQAGAAAIRQDQIDNFIISGLQVRAVTGAFYVEIKKTAHSAANLPSFVNGRDCGYLLSECPMTFTSSTVTQSSSATVVNCATDAQIARLEIVTSGTALPLTLTQIQSQFAGTAVFGNVSSTKIYYTGSSATFSTSTLFGSTTPTAGTYNINGSQTLGAGSNYFWLVYDLNNTGVLANTVDATIPQFTLSAVNRNPTVTNPAGTRTITACLAPGGVTSGLETWLKADLGYTAGAPATWVNQAPGVATLLNGTANPAKNTASTSYNYNPYIEFTGPSGAIVDGGADPIRQFVKLAGNDFNVGPTFRSLFFTSNLTDLSRTYTHLATTADISTWSIPAIDGTITGGIAGANVALDQGAYDPTDFGSSSASGTWKVNGTNVTFDATHLTTKHVLSAVTQTGNGCNINRFLGGQNDHGGFSFDGGTRDWLGPVGEVIGYTTQLTAAQRRRVHSYLAIKYGVTLGENYLNTSGSVIFTTTAPYNINIIGIGRDDIEALTQKQSHQDDDTVRIYLNSIAATNNANGGSFSSDISYVVQGANNGKLRTTATAMADIPTGLTSCAITSRLEREWKVTRTNMAQTYNMDVKLSSTAAPGSVNVAHLRLLVDADGDFTSGAQCFYNGDGTGLVFTYTNPTITITGINISDHIPNNSTRFITIASINPATPLPVELLYFDAKLNEKKTVDLKWETSSERDNDYFTIDKSLNGDSWEYVGTVDGSGTTTSTNNYTLEDLNPSFGINYYRLRQTDFNGAFSDAEIKSVTLTSPTNHFLYPNPSEKSVNVYGVNSNSDIITISDNLGKIINFESNIVSNNQIEINTSGFANGFYYVNIKSDLNKITLKLSVFK